MSIEELRIAWSFGKIESERVVKLAFTWHKTDEEYRSDSTCLLTSMRKLATRGSSEATLCFVCSGRKLGFWSLRWWAGVGIWSFGTRSGLFVSVSSTGAQGVFFCSIHIRSWACLTNSLGSVRLGCLISRLPIPRGTLLLAFLSRLVHDPILF